MVLPEPTDIANCTKDHKSVLGSLVGTIKLTSSTAYQLGWITAAGSKNAH